MMLDYFRAKRPHSTVKSPILNEEDERFFGKLAGEQTPPPLPARPGLPAHGSRKDAQIAIMDGAERIALPASPPAAEEQQIERAIEEARAEVVEEQEEEKNGSKGKSKEKAKALKSKRPLSSYFSFKRKEPKQPEDTKEASSPTKEAVENDDQSEDLSAILDQLNLAAVNNRAFSFSKESQELMEKFTLVVKDLVNGVPTAYDDLEKLFDHSEGQLTKMYEGMPPFLQNLVKSLPTKVMASLAPELLAATAAKPEEDVHVDPLYEIKGAAKKKARSKVKVPTLKSLLSKEGAVVTMLRSILNFLKLRFPAFMTGTNLLLSLSMFVLLLVLWYCHKRGREVRLGKDSVDLEGSEASSLASPLDESTEAAPVDATSPLSRTHNLPSPPSGDQETDTDSQKVTVNDMPSVQHLPSPSEIRNSNLES